MSGGSASLTEDGSLPLRNYHLIHELYVLLDAYDRQVLSRFGLIGSQYRLLLNLDTNSGLRLTELSESLLLSKSTITRIVDQLEKMGWVRRVDDLEDRRAQRVVLTPTGNERRAAISSTHLELLNKRLQGTTPLELEQLESLLKKVSSGLTNHPPVNEDVPTLYGGVGPQLRSKEVLSQPY